MKRLVNPCLPIVLSIVGIVGLAAAGLADDDDKPKPIKLVGDESSLSRVKAEPREWIGRPFVMAGGIMVDDYYNHGYREAKDTHYSLRFQQVLSDDPRELGERCHLYLRRTLDNKPIVDAILRLELPRKTLGRARVKVVLLRERYEDDLGGEWDLLELLDAQFPKEDGEWGPWIVESGKKRK